MTRNVEVISDVICPWCFIGKWRLEKAITALGKSVQVRWLPFQLNPTMPIKSRTAEESGEIIFAQRHCEWFPSLPGLHPNRNSRLWTPTESG